jgi:hypothetical protein
MITSAISSFSNAPGGSISVATAITTNCSERMGQGPAYATIPTATWTRINHGLKYIYDKTGWLQDWIHSWNGAAYFRYNPW